MGSSWNAQSMISAPLVSVDRERSPSFAPSESQSSTRSTAILGAPLGAPVVDDEARSSRVRFSGIEKEEKMAAPLLGHPTRSAPPPPPPRNNTYNRSKSYSSLKKSVAPAFGAKPLTRSMTDLTAARKPPVSGGETRTWQDWQEQEKKEWKEWNEWETKHQKKPSVNRENGWGEGEKDSWESAKKWAPSFASKAAKEKISPSSRASPTAVSPSKPCNPNKWQPKTWNGYSKPAPVVISLDC